MITADKVLDLANAILSSHEVDPASMQVYDAISLGAKHDRQIRQLAEYCIESMPMMLDIDITDTTTYDKLIGDEVFCTIGVNRRTNSATITFSNRVPWQATAYYIVSNVKADLETKIDVVSKTITIANINNASAAGNITVQFI